MRSLISGKFFGWDKTIWLATGALSLISIFSLVSAAANLDPSLAFKQGVWAAAGLFLAFIVASVPYTKWLDMGIFIYLVSIVLLVVVMIAGSMRLGATRWISLGVFSLQPSELAKIGTCLCLARFLANQRFIVSFSSSFISFLLAGIPAILIFIQPDLGTSSIIFAIWLGAVWGAGISKKALIFMGIALLVALPFGWHMLKDYQRMRLVVFMNPSVDPLGAGYTIIQSQIAIGSGRLFGRGWLSGTQNQLNFLPERHSDFLYSIIGEEWGFLGSVFIIGLFFLIIWKATKIVMDNSEPQGRILAMAISSWIGYQAIVNMGMVMGILPVVGVPLPFISYGGSAMVSAWIAIGLLQSIYRFGTRF